MRPAAHTASMRRTRVSSVAVDADLDEMRAKGRLLVFLVKVAEFDRILGDHVVSPGDLGERHAAMARPDGAVHERGVGRVDPTFCATASRSLTQAA